MYLISSGEKNLEIVIYVPLYATELGSIVAKSQIIDLCLANVIPPPPHFRITGKQ